MMLFRTVILAGTFLLAVVPVFSADFIAECNKNLVAGDLVRAEVNGIQAVATSDRSVDAHFCLAEVWRRKGFLHRALLEVETADTLAKNSDHLALRLALNEINPEQYIMMQKELLMKTSEKLGEVTAELKKYDQALLAYQRALGLAKELGRNDREIAARIGLAGVKSSMKEYAQSLDNYTEALKLAPPDSKKSDIYSNIAIVYGQMGNITGAEEYFAKSLELDRKLGDKRAEAIHRISLGLLRQTNKDYAGAVTEFRTSRLISRDLKDAYGEGTADRYFGDLYRSVNNMRLARESYAAAREHFVVARAGNETDSMTAMLNGMGPLQPVSSEGSRLVDECNNQLVAGKSAKAMENGSKAVAVSPRNADAHVCLAKALRAGGNLGSAQLQLVNAEAVVKENDYLATLRISSTEIFPEEHHIRQNEQLLTISNLSGSIAEELREFDKAISEYQRSLRLTKELADKVGETAAFASLARVYSSKGEYDRSLENYSEALKLASLESDVSSLYTNMAVVNGKAEKFSVAEELFAKSLAIDRKRGDKRAEALHLLSLGINRYLNKDYSGAASAFDKSRKISRNLRDSYGAATADRYFGDMYRGMGNVHMARASYAAARTKYAAAHAKKNADSMTAVIKELSEPQPLAGIEIGSKEVKSLLVSWRTDKRGAIDFKEIMRESSVPLELTSKEGGKLSKEDISSIAAGVKISSKQLIEDIQLDRSVLTVMVSGIPALAVNRDELENRIKQDTGLAPIFMSDKEKQLYEFIGSIAPGKYTTSLLLKISDEGTSLLALGPKGALLTTELPQGVFTAVRQQEMKPKYSAAKEIKGTQASVFRKALKSTPEFLAKKTIYLEGDLARVAAVFSRPDRDNNLVKITIADLDKFVRAVEKRDASYFTPPLGRIKDPELIQWAKSEINWVKQTFDPDHLLSGFNYLKMLMTELKVKEVYVTRGGSWLTGRMSETAVMAEKLEIRKK